MQRPSPFQDALVAMLAKGFTGKYREDFGAMTASWENARIARYVESLVTEHLGARPAQPLFVEKSVGVVFGMSLFSGRQVVLKLFAQVLTRAQLGSMLACLELLLRARFPAAAAVSEPFVTEFGQLGCFFDCVSGELRTGHEPEVRQALAETLAAFTSVVEEHAFSDLPDAPGHHPQLWLPTHRSFLKFDQAKDVAFIDAIAARAQSVLVRQAGRKIPAHLDWGSKNTRFVGNRVAAVFDWDSLGQASEAEMVGRAAAQFTAQWDLPAPIVPGASEALAFVEAYEGARARRFTAEEWTVLTASAEYLTATIARLEAARSVPPRFGFLERLRGLRETPMFPARSTE